MRTLPETCHRHPFLTRHALQRCKEMGVTRHEVLDTLYRYGARYPSPESYGPNRFISVGGRLAVVHTRDLEIITVLWDALERRVAA